MESLAEWHRTRRLRDGSSPRACRRRRWAPLKFDSPHPCRAYPSRHHSFGRIPVILRTQNTSPGKIPRAPARLAFPETELGASIVVGARRAFFALLPEGIYHHI